MVLHTRFKERLKGTVTQCICVDLFDIFGGFFEDFNI